MVDKITYRYLFPFEKIKKNSSIVIYGAGVLGQEYLKQIYLTNYCRVLGFVDKNYDKYPQMRVNVFPPNIISQLDFDYIVIAVRTKNWLSEIKRVLLAAGVKQEQIIYVLERRDISIGTIKPEIQIENVLSYNFTAISIAVFISGGIGDMVIQKRFIMELIRLAPNALIDIYTIQNSEFPEWLYSDCTQVKNVILDLGFRYREHIDNYLLSISVYGSSFLQVDSFDEGAYSEDNNFAKKISKLKEKCRNDSDMLSIPDAISFYRHIYNGENCYSWYNHSDVFFIQDNRINIPLSKETERTFNKYGLSTYITVNAGNGSCKDGRRIAKSWPIERFEKTLFLFKKQYPLISVIQIGTTDEDKLINVDNRFMGESYDMLACILKNSVFHLDIEGGLVHLATQLGTKCIVLWGPTVFEYFSYGCNINVLAGNCHNCAGLYRDINQCARNLSEPECMYSITPEMVMMKINEFLMSTKNIKV